MDPTEQDPAAEAASATRYAVALLAAAEVDGDVGYGMPEGGENADIIGGGAARALLLSSGSCRLLQALNPTAASAASSSASSAASSAVGYGCDGRHY
ncbi:hypothetical protein HXX76_005871 [Chlamydomonas incerta]|uniref:Uncharacterized protein n=1 Tax=Chlamydomonas incerta TaxID=51695 RepID=A0A835T6P9_CHLIN|nr:hypothetical protein HXX76_005871 [Chlamydomonas incerta]|eukprot:KAG2437208.1 hypothetical protein HXX76_005871 [Chlamydomonas incerta]